MKKIFCCSFFTLLLACDDGDLQIETLDFDSATIQVCDNNPVEANETNLLFKLNDTEALILELPATALKNEVSVEQIDLSVSATGPTKITYRTFSDQVAKTYFCSEVPVDRTYGFKRNYCEWRFGFHQHSHGLRFYEI